ncbi:hypothetical protein HPP92_023526 [Vanilla planifolia]|uniref:PGG domain-containing protein n=1 Tax=Vanilla planifolia TaxID=51239 RepID=A0A835PVH9_VANPL|nr:hypothetical protein HPP92_023526 [Vanilla planifolia]
MRGMPSGSRSYMEMNGRELFKLCFNSVFNEVNGFGPGFIPPRVMDLLFDSSSDGYAFRLFFVVVDVFFSDFAQTTGFHVKVKPGQEPILYMEEEAGIDSKQLFKYVMDGKWDAVVDMYKIPLAQRAKVTRAQYTVLHLAVSEGDEEVVEKLLGHIKEKAEEILCLKNEVGDTPLHIAAALGLTRICGLLADKGKDSAFNARNSARETPLYVAAHHGKKEAFFALQDRVAKPDQPISFCRRGDGNTILHAAVHGEYFDLAFEIIKLYPNLVNSNNEMGQSALHILADKPLVFKSGRRFRRVDKLIYACIIVDPLKPKYKPNKSDMRREEGTKMDDEINLPENYATCFDLYRGLRTIYHLIVSCFSERSIKGCCIAVEGENEHTQHASSSNDLERADKHGEKPSVKQRIPENYITAFYFLKIVIKVLLVLLGIGIRRIENLRRKKIKHERAYQVMKELVGQASNWEYDKDGKQPDKDQKHDKEIDTSEPPQEDTSNYNGENSEEKSQTKNQKKDQKVEKPVEETPILIAAMKGVTEMVKKILDTFPIAVQDFDSNHKNVILLSVQHRQPQVYKLMLERKMMRDSVFGKVDKDGNSALHLAARSAGDSHLWVIPGAALQMQWEIKWYKFVKYSMEPSFFQQYNKEGKTAKQIFIESHVNLTEEGGKWLTNTSQSCTVVAALIATVAFASATTVPGGLDQQTGYPVLERKPAFAVFAVSALVALCFSVTSLITFLAVLTSRYQEKDFERDLPMKLILGLSTLFMSIAAMLVSFCSGHFFVLEDRLRYGAFPIYVATCLPITFFAASQFPLYIDLVRAIIAPVPERTDKSLSF